MKKILFAITWLFSANIVLAVFIIPFTSWDEVSEKSSDIIIARCIVAPNTTFVVDGMIWSDIEILSVLKGNPKSGPARMVSQYGPHQGERFLAFATYQSTPTYEAYNATESYRIIPIGSTFLIESLAGKTLTEQIQLVQRNRLEEVKRELEKVAEEKQRLEKSLR